MDAEWSMDFCLACDKQSPEGPYCSQSCRLADLERSGSPRSACASTPTSASSSWSNGFYLPPAIDFHAYSKPAAAPLPPSTADLAAPSKRDSLSSLDTSVCGDHALSSLHLTEAARRQLQLYESAFDHSRHKKFWHK